MDPVEFIFRMLVWMAYFFGLYFLIFWLCFYIENRKKLTKDLKKKYVLKKPQNVTIVIPAFNEEATIAKTLDSVVNLDYPLKKIHVMVINDGSSDGTRKEVEKSIKKHKHVDIKLINKENGGKANALNFALSKIKTKFFVCMDADSFINREALREMMARFEDDKDLALTTPIMKIYKPKNWLQKFQRLEYMSAMLVIKLMGYMEANYVAPGPFSTYRTDVVREVGGFDTDSLVEDQEIAYKIQSAHYKIRQCTDAIVYTVGPATLKELQNQRNRWFKGTLLTLVQYRRIAFNRKYGDFGVFQMPFTFISYFLAMLLMLSFGWFFIRPIYQKLKDLYLIRFDVLPYLENWRLTISPLDMDVGASFVMYLLFIGAVILMLFSARMTKDKVSADGKIHLIPYFFVYFLILSFIAVRVCVEVLMGKKQKW